MRIIMAFLRYSTSSFLLLCLVQCTSQSGGDADDDSHVDRGCLTMCDDRCDAFVGCGFAVSAACADDCKRSLKHADCRGFRPADQYTCGELESVHECAAYCTEFCVWASACGSFDQQLCLEGCSYGEPDICNPASVAARTCDELKPEARTYDDRGRSLQDSGLGYAGFSDYTDYGLCRDADDCELPDACDLATNTCGACVQSSDCERLLGINPYLCSNGQCLEVDCVTDADCGIGFRLCQPSTHTCVECLSNADCPSTYLSECDPESSKCVECLNDSHCDDGTSFDRCDTGTHHCVQ